MGTNTLDHVSELLSPYLDGQVTPVERQLVEDHVRACAECGAELEELRALKGMLGRLPQRQPPRSFVLGPRPERPAALSGTIGGFARALSSAAAALVVAAVGVSLIVQGLPRNTTSVAAPALDVASAPARAQPVPIQAAASAQAAARPAASAAAQAPAQGAAPAQAGARAQPSGGPGLAPGSAAANAASSGATLPAPFAGGTPASAAQPRQGGINVPRLAGELLLLLAGLGLAIYSVRWWRS